MRVARFAFLIAGGVVLTALVLAAAAAIIVGSYQPRYDENDPDYARYVPLLAKLHEALRQRGASAADMIDFVALNGGKWKTACIFGGYTKPSRIMRELGATISDEDQARLTEAGFRGFRLAEVEEFEILIAYIRLDDRAHFIHFATGIGPGGQHLRKCISKPETTVILDGYL